MGRRSTAWRLTAIGVVLSLLASAPGAEAAVPANQYSWKLPELQQEKSVKTGSVAVRGKPDDPASKAVTKVVQPVWPAEAQADVDLAGGARAGQSPVSVRRKDAVAAAKPAKVQVKVKGRDTVKALGLNGVVFTVADAGGASAEQLRLDVDYRSFASAYGGDYGSRLKLVALPACALSTPDKAECRKAMPLAAGSNNLKSGTVSGDVTLPAAGARDGTSPQSVGAGSSDAMVFAATSSGSGGNGSFTATSLAPAGSWSAGGSSGDFNYGYPVRVPPAIAGGTPSVSLGYSSQSLDGRTSATNNQASWVGDGWDVSPGGFIERQYKPCSTDLGGNNGQTKTGDQCWATDNATISLVGVSGELVKDASTGVWRPKNDDGARIERLTGATNGDNDGEHWKVTTTDGTQYFLGLNRLPGWSAGKPETQSAWTTPVFGNNAGEPCNAGTFDASWCQQAYRWNLDYSVDPHGNVTSYYYEPETNHYGRNADPAKGTQYVRGGHLTRVEYGLRNDDIYGAAGARILFDTAERCIPGGAITCDPSQLNSSTASSWPDVPADQICNAGEQCTLRLTPTFFTRKKLTKITTQVGNGSGGFNDVDSWSLTQDFPATGDGTSPAMNLKSIVHTGRFGGSIELPPTTFDRTAMGNRVDTGNDNLSPLTRYRITGITNESGGYTAVRYSDPDCVPGSRMPSAPESNTLRCYPTWWTPDGALQPILDYFHKYVVTDVTGDDRTGASSLIKTHYDYVGDPAWHFDENDFADADKRTWSQWRGYGTVRTVKGEPSGPQTVAETLYLRGMHGDKLPSGTRDVSVSNSEGEPVQDLPRLQGFVRENRQYNGGTLTAASVNDPWVSAVTATGADGEQAFLTGTAAVRGRTLVEGGAWRRTKVAKTFDSIGIATQTEDHGDLAVNGDETCTRSTFARNDAAWMLSYASQIETVKGTCAVTASASTVLSIARSSFDGQAHGVPPTRGDITKAEALDRWDGSGQQFVTASTSTYDAYGRPLDVFDASGKKTTTAYTPASGPLTQVTSTNPLGHVSTGYFQPAWGASTASVDANGRRADLEHDALGRLVKAWTPGHPKASSQPDAIFEYTYNTNAPSVVAAKQQQDNGSYLTSYTLYDGMFRERQTQSVSPAGGRQISDTFYDSRGLAYKHNGAYWNDQAPSGTLAGVFDNQVPNQTVTEFDGMERPTASIYRKYFVEQWRSTTAYGGDRVHTTPPQGSAATTLISDAHGRTTEKRQYTNGLGSAFDATKYTYTPAGQLATVTDPASNVWRHFYDLRGRKTSTDDPDAGHSSTTYDVAGKVLTTTDGRNKTLAYTYDDLGRKTGLFEGTTSGTKLAEWEYDTLTGGLGMPTLSRRWAGGQAYTRKVNGYDAAGRATGEKIILPAAAEGVLGTTYEAASGYTYTGKPAYISYRNVVSGGNIIVPTETVSTHYNGFGLPERTSGYVTGTNYSAFGEVLRETYDGEESPNNLWVTNFYEEGTRRLERTIADRETQTAYRIADRNYTYDASGNIQKVADTPEGGASDIQCFAYDFLRRMTEAWTPSSGDCGAARSTSALGGAAPYWMSWSFDKTGNRLTQTQHASAGDTTNTFTYPAAGASQPHTVSKVDTAGPNGTSQDTYSYDASGNTTSRKISGNDQTLEYDAEGRVSKVTNADGKVSTYLYDADGTRLIAREPSGTTVYAHGQEINLATGTSTPSWTRYYGHNGHVVAMRNSVSGLKWLLGDHQGTQLAAVTAGNLAATTRRQTPFGGARGSVGSWPDKHGFVGGTNEESGLTRVGARLYDSTIGRFLSADPIVDNNDPQQLNGYAYSNNSPVTFSDPTGLYANCGPDGIKCGLNPAQYSADDRSQYQHNEAVMPQAKLAKSLQQQQAVKDQAVRDGLAAENISWDEYQEALKNAHKTKWDVIKEVAWEILKDISGWNDIVDCFTKGDIMACGGLVLNLVPVGKVAKIFEAGYKAFKAVKAMTKVIEKAQGLLRRVDRIKARAEEIATQAMNKLRGKSGCNSFKPGTLVLLADGSKKPIEQMQVGDKVLAKDPATGESSSRAVVGTIIGQGAKHLVEITVDGGGSVTATDEHPFWLPDQKRWGYAKDLRVGSVLQTSAGTWVQVSAVRAWTAVERVHNLTVDDLHTYFAQAGAIAILNHNQSCPIDKSDTLLPGPHAKEGVALVDGNIDDPGVRQLVNESGDLHGCHTCGATTPGTKSGDWIRDHQPSTKMVGDGTPQTAYPHCWSCARRQGGQVNGVNRGWTDEGP